MCDKSSELNPNMFGPWAAEVIVAYKEYEKELRRSFEISAGFIDKVSALDAGSIALAASVIIAITAKSDLPPYLLCRMHQIVHGLVVIVFLLLVSLVLTVLHHFLVVHIARLDAKYSEIEFPRRMMRSGLAIVRDNAPTNDKALVDQLEKSQDDESFKEQVRIVKKRKFWHKWADAFGYTSTSLFLVAYAAVAFYLLKLW
jgi:hypothetical protein